MTEPFHDWAGPFLFDPATLMGFSFALRSFPCRRIPAFLRFIPTCRYPIRSRASPLIFTGCQSRISRLLPGVTSRKRPKARTIGPASGSYCRRQAEPLLFSTLQSILHSMLNEPAANPAMGFLCFSRACRMLFHSTRMLAPARHRARANAANRRSLTFVGCHPLMGFVTTDTGSADVLFA